MTLEQLHTILTGTELPVAYNAFPEETAPALPFICYRVVGSNNFFADGSTYEKINDIDVELYTKTKDQATEALLEQALGELCWNKEENYLADEKCFEIIYNLEV